MVDLAAFMSRNMTGNVSSPFNKTSMRFPPAIVAPVWASIVGKKVGSPRVISGICSTETTVAQPANKNMANNQYRRFIRCRKKYLTEKLKNATKRVALDRAG